MKFLPKPYLWIIFCLVTTFTSCVFAQKKSVFAKKNLVAWCIVPFDAKERNAEERAQMLKELGITKEAYDWREKHIPYFDDELRALKKHKIELTSFWMMSGAEPEKDRYIKEIFDFIERNNVKTQIWLLMGGIPNESQLTQEQKVQWMEKPIRYIAEKAASLGCQVALYNHGGWFGEPENQIEIIEQVKMKNVGIVYNFHHARWHHERFATFYPKMLPHLLCVNVAGLRTGVTERFFRVGQGDVELEMMKIVAKSSYKGPIGIINHDENLDASVGLQEEIDGLQKVLKVMGDKKSLKTY